MRRRRRPVLFLLLGLLALVGAAAAQPQREGGAPSFLERQLESLVPGLRVEGLEGAWRAAPRARRMTLSDASGPWLVLDDVRLDIAPTALLRGVLRLEGMEVRRLAIERLPEPDPAAPSPPPPRGPDDRVLPALPELPVDLALDRLAVERVEVAEAVLGQAAAFALTGRAALGGGRLSARLDLQRLDREGSLGLDLALTPGEDRLAATLALREAAPGGIGPTLLGLPDQPLALDLRLDGPAGGAALSLTAALGPEIGARAEGSIRATADGAFGATLSGEARAAAPLLPAAYAPLASPARFDLDLDLPAAGPLALRRLDLALPAGTASVAGTLDLGREAPDLTASLRLAESARFAGAGLPLPPGLAWAGLAAEARVTGTLAAPRVALRAAPEGLATGIPQADAVLGPAPALSGTIALPGPVVDLALEGAEGRLAAQGSLGEPMDLAARLALPRLAVLGTGSEGALEAELRAEGQRADPNLTLAARSGRIAVAGRVLEALALDARIETPLSAPRAEARLDARLEGEPVTLSLRGAPEGEARLRLEQAEARVATARLAASGLLDTAALLFEGTARLEAADLAPLGRLAGIAGLAGRLVAEARLAPRDAAPGGQVQGFEARLEAPALALGGNALSGLRLTAAGTPAALDLALQARGATGAAPLGPVSARARVAAAEGGGRRIDLAALEAEVAGERLRLAAPARIDLLADGGIVLGNGGLAIAGGRGGRLALRGRWGPAQADLTASLAALPLALAAPFAPGIDPRGTLSGEARIEGPVAQPGIRATLQGSGIASGADWARGLPALGLRAEARLGGDGAAEARAELDAGAAGRILATARLPQGFGPAASLAATLEGGVNLAPLAAPFLAAGADRVTGRLTVALRAEGPLAQPRLGGRATLSGAEYRNPVLGARVSNIEGSLAGAGTRLVVERLQGRTAGGGTIALQGGIDLGAPGLPADLGLTLRRARPVVSDLVTATLDAALRLEGPVLAPGGSLSGTVTVLGAEIRIPETLPASTPVLENVRTRGTPPPGAVPPPRPRPAAAGPGAEGASGSGSGALPPLGLAVTVAAPRQVWVRGRGVNAELGGTVRIGGTLAQPVPSGELTLRAGTLDVLARRLTFSRGTIGFATGTLTPVLDLSAQAQTRSATITVAVKGTPQQPQVTFTASPELPQDEVLARLLFDRATSNLSPFEIAQIAQAVAQLSGLGGAGGGPLDRVRGALGLDRLGVTTDPEGRAAVEAGRYVAPGVFVGVRQGTQGQTGVAVQLELTPRLRLEGQTATGPAGDRIGLSYELEY